MSQSPCTISDEVKAKLLPYQLEHHNSLVYSISSHNRALDASDTGTGKTYTAIATCLTLGLKPLIVCPKSVLNSWRSVIGYFKAPCYGITNYESLQNCKYYSEKSLLESGCAEKSVCPFIKRSIVPKTPTHGVSTTETSATKQPANLNFASTSTSPVQAPANVPTTSTPQSSSYGVPLKEEKQKEIIEYTYVWQNLPNDIIVIFDETHRCKNSRTLNSVLLYTIAKTSTKILMLSATVSDKPENFALTGYTLGLYRHVRECGNWIERVSKGYNHPMSGVNNVLYPEYASRMRIRNLGKLFPDNQVIAECYDMKTAIEIEREYKLIESEVQRLKNHEENSGNALARMLYSRMRIEQLKIPTFIEQANNYLEEGNAVTIFVNFTQSLRTIADELRRDASGNERKVCVIHGQQTLEERTQSIDDFNSDKSQIIVCNSRSGGVGISLHDQHGNFPRMSIISPSWSAQDIIQVLGRPHRANGKTAVRQRIVFCKGTIEETICKNLKNKIKNIAMLNDGDLLSYNIDGLNDNIDEIGIDTNGSISEFNRLFLKISVLNEKRKRLEADLKDTVEEIGLLEQVLHSLY